MKFSAFIPPNFLDSLADDMDYDFLEPLEDKKYIDFYRARSGHIKFLDNGLVEFKGSISGYDLYRWARLIDATYVCSPDKVGDWPHNKHQAIKFCGKWPRDKTFVALAGPQPLDFYLQSVWVLSKGFAGYCLPYRLNRFAVNCPFLKQHLFGFKKPEDYKPYRGDSTIDTVEPINAAIKGIRYDAMGFQTLPRGDNYLTAPALNHVVDMAKANIVYFKRMVNG